MSAATWCAELAALDRRLEAYLDHLRANGRSHGERAVSRFLENREAETLVETLLAEHDADELRTPIVEETGAAPAPAMLARAIATYGLDELERDVLVLAVAPEVDGRYGRVLTALDDRSRARPTVGLALELARVAGRARGPEAIAAFLPEGRLVRHGLVKLEGDGPLGSRGLRAAPGFWPRLVGCEPRTAAVPCSPMSSLANLELEAPVRACAEEVVAWLRAASGPALLVVLGARGSGRDAFAEAVLGELDRRTFRVTAAQLDVEEEVRGIARDARWHGAAIVVRADGELATPTRVAALADLPAPVVWISENDGIEALKGGRGEHLVVRLAPPTPVIRRAIWARFLGADAAATLDVAAIAARFPFGPHRIETAVRMARARARTRGPTAVIQEDELRAVSRDLPEHSLGALARKLGPPESRELVVPLATRRELELVEAWMRHGRDEVGGTGRGLACLFHGPPGTGKTHAAQLIATTIGLDLYRIDLSQVVSKYLGDTEKNLGRVFDEARAANLVLFFDEADALFGKRTEVKDAHDRYANVETGFLLQRLEVHDGLVILASNLRSNLDAAFLRRLQIVAEFPLPGPSERRRIWEGMLPTDVRRDVDLDTLARFTVSGGDIRNAVAAARLLAAEDGHPVGMRDLTRGLWRELHKAGRLVDAAAFGRWREEILGYAGAR